MPKKVRGVSPLVVFELRLVREYVPDELKRLRVWLKWQLGKEKPNGKRVKIPYYANGERRSGDLDSPDDRAELVTFDEIVESFDPDRDAGLALALGPIGDGRILSGLDLDKCLRAGKPDERAERIIIAAGSYAETTPYGEGIHILGWGDIGTHGANASGLEVYSGRRFFTVTGRTLNSRGLMPLEGAARLACELYAVQRAKATEKGEATKPRRRVNRDDLIAAIDSMPNDFERSDWVTICLALKHELGESGREAWIRFSKKWREYDAEDTVERWETAKPNGEAAAGTIFHLARKYGWTGGATVDLSTLALPSAEEIAGREVEEKVPLFDSLLYPGAWLLTGRPKIGKSWVLMQLALAVAQGSEFLDYLSTGKREVLHIAAEDDDARLQSRFATLRATPPGNLRVINRERLDALAKEYAARVSFVQFLSSYLDAQPNIGLIIVDTEAVCRDVWNAYRQPENAARRGRATEEDYRQTREFDEIALPRKMVIVLTNHSRKQRGEWQDIHELINRTGAAAAGVSGSISMADDPGVKQTDCPTKRRVLGIRGRDMKDDILLAVEQTDDGSFSVLGDYWEVNQTRAQDELLHTVEELQGEAEPGEYVTTRDVAEHLGLKRGSVKRAISRMLEHGHTKWRGYAIDVRRGSNGGIRLTAISGRRRTR